MQARIKPLRAVMGILLMMMTTSVFASEFEWAPGQPVGATFHEITLTDNDGQSVTLGELKGKNGTLLVFSRSTDW